MFGGGFFGGGMPEGMGMPRRPKGNSSRYYEILGVPPSSTQDELKKAHRKLALKHHPDKGGDSNTFKEINEAYDTLKDPEKRQIYDDYGEDAIKEGMGPGGPGGSMNDIFDMFTGGGGGGGRGRSQRERKSEDVSHKLAVTLDDLYNGTTKKLSLSRNLPCSPCSGSGTKSGKKYECSTCRGTGVQVHIRPLGPGMVQQIQARCSSCAGSGFGTPASDQCPSCKGKCLVSEKKTFEVHVEQGMKAGARVVLRGEAGCSEPGLAPGDVVLIIAPKEHALFKRVGIDLIMTKSISLSDALCGTSFNLKHLDGRILSVRSADGEVIKPDTFKSLREEGMPIHGRPYQKGNLYIHFKVEFPSKFDAAQIAALRSVLPSTPPRADNADDTDMDSDDIHEAPTLTHVEDIEDELKSRVHMAKGGSSAYDDEDDDDPRGGQRATRTSLARGGRRVPRGPPPKSAFSGTQLCTPVGAHNGSMQRWSMSKWLENKAAIDVPVGLDLVWSLWDDRERIPRWMPWIKTVKVLESDPRLSRWTLSTNQFGRDWEFSWLARNLQPIKGQKIHWQSEPGSMSLPGVEIANRGQIRFVKKSAKLINITLTISYEVPDVLVPFANALTPLVEGIIAKLPDDGNSVSAAAIIGYVVVGAFAVTSLYVASAGVVVGIQWPRPRFCCYNIPYSDCPSVANSCCSLYRVNVSLAVFWTIFLVVSAIGRSIPRASVCLGYVLVHMCVITFLRFRFNSVAQAMLNVELPIVQQVFVGLPPPPPPQAIADWWNPRAVTRTVPGIPVYHIPMTSWVVGTLGDGDCCDCPSCKGGPLPLPVLARLGLGGSVSPDAELEAALRAALARSGNGGEIVMDPWAAAHYRGGQVGRPPPPRQGGPAGLGGSSLSHRPLAAAAPAAAAGPSSSGRPFVPIAHPLLSPRIVDGVPIDTLRSRSHRYGFGGSENWRRAASGIAMDGDDDRPPAGSGRSGRQQQVGSSAGVGGGAVTADDVALHVATDISPAAAVGRLGGGGGAAAAGPAAPAATPATPEGRAWG
ncbi:hypothetical protein FOA52_005248 [Chlamydomonas sp. UWO 241]|nr:hypothetical protein FOA52_005248 [Chlamydomonas sp. UWO 241]